MSKIPTTAAERDKPKAYSYLRFSTPEQSGGDSFRRQSDMAREYAKLNDLDLDTSLSFHDLGVSGYRGKNAETGRLSDFLEAVQSGHVEQGSFLLVEQLDRLSRLVPRKALRVLEDIADAGVTVVTLNDQRRYTSASLNNDPMDLLVSIMTFMRANEESATKARRLKAVWANKRTNALNRPITSRVPAWLTLDRERQQIQIIPERAEVIQRIYSMTLEGIGQHSIAQKLNAEEIKPWGRAQYWHRSYVSKILRNSAVVGTLSPMSIDYTNDGKMIKRAEPPVDGYFPQVIEQETFSRVQTLISSGGGAARGRQAHQPISNILARLAACPNCGSTMTRVHKGKKSHPSLVCTKAKAGAGCGYKSIPYQRIEERLLQVLPGALKDFDGVQGPEGLDNKITATTQQLWDLVDQADTLTDNLSHQSSARLRQRLAAIETEIDNTRTALRQLLGQLEETSGKVLARRRDGVLQALSGDNEQIDRQKINAALRLLFDKAIINWPKGTIDLVWKQGGMLSIQYDWID